MLHNDEPRDAIIANVKELTTKLQLADAEVIAIVSTDGDEGSGIVGTMDCEDLVEIVRVWWS